MPLRMVLAAPLPNWESVRETTMCYMDLACATTIYRGLLFIRALWLKPIIIGACHLVSAGYLKAGPGLSHYNLYAMTALNNYWVSDCNCASDESVLMALFAWMARSVNTSLQTLFSSLALAWFINSMMFCSASIRCCNNLPV